MATPRILVVGSINVDIVALMARLPAPGETVTGGTLLINHGGKGANQAVAAHRLGAEVRFIGCVGDDTFGQELRQSMATEGIGVDGLATMAGSNSGTAVIVVDTAGRNQIAVASGANMHLTVEWVGRFAADRPGKPRLLLAPHTDTVSVAGMTIDPFGGEIREGKIWGRGSSDTKGSIAAMLWALHAERERLGTLAYEVWFAGLAVPITRAPRRAEQRRCRRFRKRR